MPSLISCAQAGFEPIQGYVLREKLGAGGYGEVWLADAPGGLKKAIKFVFGSLDESRANSELKALHRIRQVTHPFLLSLERIEIVDSQLVIVTELADGSLCDRYQKCREDGFIGIPRDQLLDYLRDAADALDFLCQKHDLQHLDVKPANMLLVADRVKVADFGLVKDIQSNSMSMLGGMTPTYAAPEMFDGRPGRFSDQYSLAIVYQELLTGTLPFGGRTTAQLANEHLHRAPNLDPVPPSDRPVLTKALAKKATQRYASCREFIDHLLQVDRNSGRRGPSVSNDSDKNDAVVNRIRPVAQKIESNTSDVITDHVSLASSTHTFEKREVTPLAPLDVHALNGSSTSPCLFIGLGQTGADMIIGLRSEMARNGVPVDSNEEFTWLLLDTDAQTIDAATDDLRNGHLNHDATLHLPLKPSQYYRECDEACFSPISRRWLYNVPRSRSTEGVRPLAMLAFLDHAQLVHKAITNYFDYLQGLVESATEEASKGIRVYLLASAHGATGGGMLAEVGFLVRRQLEERGLAGQIQAVLTVAEQNELASTELPSASAVACLSEIAHYVQSGGLHPGVPSIPASLAVSKAPIDNVYLIHGGVLGDRSGWATAIDQGVEYLYVDAMTLAGDGLDRCRHVTHQLGESSSEQPWTPWLRTLCSRRIDITTRLNPSYIANLATFQVAQRWLQRFRSNQLEASERNNESTNPLALAQKKKSLEQIDFLVSDLFREKRWTAQAWLARCMEMLMQDTHVPLEGEDLDGQALSALLEDEVEIEIERIAERLQVDLSQCKYDASHLLDNTLQQLQDWFDDQWRSDRPPWSFISKLIEMISKRFQEQGTSLRNISVKFRVEHDRFLEKLHAREHTLSQAETESEMVELDRLEVQARLHDFAGRMLVRLGAYFSTVLNVWKTRATRLQEEFASFCIPLAEELDLCVSENGILRDAVMPVPQDWEPVRSMVDAEIDQEIENWVIEELRSVWSEQDFDSSTEQSDVGKSLDANTLSIGGTLAMSEIAAALEVEMTRTKALLLRANEISETQCEGLGLSWLKVNNTKEVGKSGNRTSIVRQVRESTPPLVQWGGAKRNLLLLPSNCSEDVDVRWQAMFTEPISILRTANLIVPIVLCDAEQIILPEILIRLWRIAYDKKGLVNRIESRIDVDWLPVPF